MMPNNLISEGKTTKEAIENGLKKLGVSKDKVEIKILENEDKRSFFSILTPRTVKVELTVKEEIKKEKQYDNNIEDIKKAEEQLKAFLKVFLNQVDENLTYKTTIEEYTININIQGESAGRLIGYRGDTLNSLQVILSTIANKGKEEKIRLILDIEGYREKRKKALEELAQKVSKTVLKTGKLVTLEPMTPYERKIIHSYLQENKKVKTYSIGEDQNRRVVIAKAE